MSKEYTALLSKQQMPSATEYLHAGLMAVASFTNIVGSFFAINAGADKVHSNEGDKLNPFFYTALATSTLYFGANMLEVGRIAYRRAGTWAEIEESRRAEARLKGIEII